MPQGSLRLLILATQYFPAVGGSEAQARLLAREFRHRGHTVEVWTRRLSLGDAVSETLDDVLLQRLGPNFSSTSSWARRLERFGFTAGLFWRLRARWRSFDVVLANQLQYAATAAVLACRGTRLPVVARSASSGPDSEMYRPEWSFRIQKWLLTRYLDHVVVMGPTARTDCERAGFAPCRMTLIPNGTAQATTDPVARAPTPPLRALWLGKFRREKRTDLAVKAWIEAHLEGDLHVVGDGPERAAIEGMLSATDPGMTRTIHLKGLAQDPRSELAAAHVFLQSSDTEGLSNALVEAMSVGCACVATDVGDTRFVLGGADVGEVPVGSFVRAEAGLLVRAGDVTSMARALQALAQPALREALGRAAQTRCRTNHGMAFVATRYEDLFARLLPLNS